MKNKKTLGLAGAALLSWWLAVAGTPTIPPTAGVENTNKITVGQTTPGVEDNNKITSDQIYTNVSHSPDSILTNAFPVEAEKPTQDQISKERLKAYYETVPYVANIVYADGTEVKKALEWEINLSDDPISYMKTFLAKQKDATISVKENSTWLNIFVFKKVGDSLFVTVDNDWEMKHYEIDLHGKWLSKKEKDFLRLVFTLTSK